MNDNTYSSENGSTTQYLVSLSVKGKDCFDKIGLLNDEGEKLFFAAVSLASGEDDQLRIIEWLGRAGGIEKIRAKSRKEFFTEFDRLFGLSAKQTRDLVKAKHEKIHGKRATGSTAEMVEEMNRSHANTIIGSRNLIVRTIPDPNDPERNMLEFIKPRELAGLYLDELYEAGSTAEGKPIFKDKVTAWLSNPSCRKYPNGVFFLPSRPGVELVERPQMLNLWNGFRVEANAGDWSLIDWHIKNILAGGNEDVYQYILNWCARTIQQPEKQAGTVLVFRGTNRTGKGLFASFLKSLWGEHGFTTAHASHIVGNFNKHLAQTCLLFADEALLAGNKQHENVLKALITEPDFAIESKGIDAVAMPNRLKIVMATNESWAIPTNVDDERFCVCDVSTAKKGNRDYFKKLAAIMDSEQGQAAFLLAMNERDISDFIPGEIPVTEGLRQQRQASLPTVWQWWLDCLERGYACSNGDFGGHWNERENSSDLYRSYLSWCNDTKQTKYDILTQTGFGREFSEIYRKKRSGSGTMYFIGSIDDAEQVISDKLGI